MKDEECKGFVNSCKVWSTRDDRDVGHFTRRSLSCRERERETYTTAVYGWVVLKGQKYLSERDGDVM
jgi:hypothetical protein